MVCAFDSCGIVFSCYFLGDDGLKSFKRKKNEGILNLAQRNAVAILNELRTGLVYNTLEQTGPCHAPIFKISVEVDGQQYIGTGGSKKTAKCQAAELALKSFIQFPNNSRVISPNISLNSSLDFTSDSFEAAEEGDKQKNVTNGIDAKKTTKGPVMLLNELYPNAKYECTTNESDVYSRFKITIKIDGDTFFGTGTKLTFRNNLHA